MTAAVFLDRDGTLNRKPADGKYVTSPGQLELLPGALDAVLEINNRGMLAIVVTNQRGVALGRMTQEDVREVHAELQRAAARAGARLDAIYHCPHQHGACDCRKPKPGLFYAARRDFPEISFEQSFMVGDSPADVMAGERLGMTTVKIGDCQGVRADHRSDSLQDALRVLV